MPFKSEKQRRFMFAEHPDIAERWAHEHPDEDAGLPRYAHGRTTSPDVKSRWDELKARVRRATERQKTAGFTRDMLLKLAVSPLVAWRPGRFLSEEARSGIPNFAEHMLGRRQPVGLASVPKEFRPQVSGPNGLSDLARRAPQPAPSLAWHENLGAQSGWDTRVPHFSLTPSGNTSIIPAGRWPALKETFAESFARPGALEEWRATARQVARPVKHTYEGARGALYRHAPALNEATRVAGEFLD